MPVVSATAATGYTGPGLTGRSGEGNGCTDKQVPWNSGSTPGAGAEDIHLPVASDTVFHHPGQHLSGRVENGRVYLRRFPDDGRVFQHDFFCI